jgi:anti-sigma regulatory factor (Ser/Thr protein kinase)
MTETKAVQTTVPADIERLNEVQAFVGALMDAANLDGGLRRKIELVIEEIYVNIASYSYPGGDGDATIHCRITDDAISLEFRDRGRPFNPLKRKPPDITLSEAEREPGGFGLFLVGEIMDDVQYRYEGGFNILSMRKSLS